VLKTIDLPSGFAPSYAAVDAQRRPVILATLSVRIDQEAERFALESALETGAALIIANMLPLRVYPVTQALARDKMSLPHEEDLEAVRATAQRAAQLGISTELLRVTSPRPLTALIEIALERRPALVVLGPDRRLTPRWLLWRGARNVRRKLDCLVWIVPPR